MTTKPKSRKPAAKAADPIFAAIAEHKALEKEWSRLYSKLGDAEREASKKYGNRPWSLIAWRTYSAIGGCEIERAREQFLEQPGANPEEIEIEYQDAKRRETAGEYEGIAWDHRTGIASMREQYEKALAANEKAAARMARTKPTTPAGAGALVAYIWSDIKEEIDLRNWSTIALKTVAVSLAQMNRAAA
jgi:hypothetical protein